MESIVVYTKIVCSRYVKDMKWHSVDSRVHVGWLPDHWPFDWHDLLELPEVIKYPVLQV